MKSWLILPPVPTWEEVCAKSVCVSLLKERERAARVITFTVVVAVEETEINLLYIYDKAERESVSAHEIEALLRKNGL